MRIHPDRPVQLTYCTNIHPGDGWAAVDANVRRFGPALKRRFAPATPFGLGLRLSARDARELLDGRLETFRTFLDDEGLYVALINGFPFGTFHHTVVKEQVYAPDWRDEARVAYTLDLVRILQRLLPEQHDGGVSTAPLSYKAWVGADDHDGWACMTDNVVRVAAAMARARNENGVRIHLDIEPEPDCCLETSDETVAFFDRWLLPRGVPALAAELGIGREAAEEALREHVRVCFDCCHFAVEHEDPIAALARLERAGIRVGRIQLSSALRVDMPADPEHAVPVQARLRTFADPVYLHQVVTRRDSNLQHFPDLAPALDAAGDGSAEWRIHFHVPLFARDYQGLGSTQDDVRRVIDAALTTPITTHLEIETYTWDVLPGELKVDLLESIAREYDWVLAGRSRSS